MLTVTIRKGITDPETHVSMKVKLHSLPVEPIVYTHWLLKPGTWYAPPEGLWAVPLTGDPVSNPIPPYNGVFADIEIGYLGPDKRKRRGLYLYDEVSTKLLTWNNFYRQEYKGIDVLPKGGYRVSPATCGYNIGHGYGAYGGNTAAIISSHLPRSRVSYPTLRFENKMNWEWEPHLPTVISSSETATRMFDYTLQLNHRVHFYKAAEKLRSADIGLALAESAETIKLLRTIEEAVRTVFKPLIKAKKGDPVALITALSGVASLWLTWSYGIKPLISDFVKLVRDIDAGKFGEATNGDNLSIFGFDCGFSDRNKKVEIEYGSQYFARTTSSMTGSVTCRVSGTPEQSTRRWAAVVSDGCGVTKVREVLDSSWRTWEDFPWPSNPTYPMYPQGEARVKFTRKSKHEYVFRYTPQFTLTQLGLNNPALIAWELTPLSMILDWIAEVSDYLANRRGTVGLHMLASLHSIDENWALRDPLGHTSNCHRFFRVTGNETDGSTVRSPSGLIYAGSLLKGTAIPKAEVEWGTGVDVEAAVEGGRETNALALTTVFAAAAVQLRQAKTEALEAISSGRVHQKHSSQLMKILKYL